jgi:hypothetical protein
MVGVPSGATIFATHISAVNDAEFFRETRLPAEST